MIATLGYQGDLLDEALLATAFAAAGLKPESAASKADLLARSVTTLRDRLSNHADLPLCAFMVPGRIEVLGKHTDYVGGSSLLAAAEQGFVLACAPREDRAVRVTDVRYGQTIEFPFDGEILPSIGHWSNYPMTVARRLARNFPEASRGAEIAFGSDLPSASGMSSSSAMIVAFFLALSEVNHVGNTRRFQANVTSPVQLASYLATIENGQSFGSLKGDRGVGTAGGSEDHTAILCCQPGSLTQYAYCPARHVRDIPLSPSYTFVIASSGVAAEKTGAAMGAYNRAAQLAGLAATMWRQATGWTDPHLAAALASCSGDAAEVRRVLASAPLAEQAVGREEVLARFDHFCRENEQSLPAAVAALESGNMAGFGRAVEESQAAAEELLGNQIPETKFLAAEARRLGATAASAFGAGFGGSVWALLENNRAARFRAAWSEAYARQFPQHGQDARFFASTAGPPVLRIA